MNRILFLDLRLRLLNRSLFPIFLLDTRIESRNPYLSTAHSSFSFSLPGPTTTIVYQIIHSDGIPERLVDSLSREFNFVTFVGVGIKSDLEKLEANYGIGGGALYTDLREFVAEEYDRKELKNAGLKELGRVVLRKEVEMPTAVTVSRWDNRQLTVKQVQYACVDAFMSYEIAWNAVMDAVLRWNLECGSGTAV